MIVIRLDETLAPGEIQIVTRDSDKLKPGIRPGDILLSPEKYEQIKELIKKRAA